MMGSLKVVPEEQQETDEADTSLLENMIETSRNQSLMPECFNCPNAKLRSFFRRRNE